MAIMEELVDRVEAFGPYGYIPELAPAIVFVVMYGICFLGHAALAFKTKTFSTWGPTLVLGCLAETVANVLRIYGHFHPHDEVGDGTVNSYIAQQVLSVLTPAFFAAAHFTVLGLTILTFGKQYALISPRFIVPFFVSVDFVSLVLQGAGSGLAAVAEQADPVESTIPGSWVVVAGLFVQLLAYMVFNIMFIVFALRTMRDPPQHPLWTPRMRLFLGMVWISSLLVLLRSTYRLAELMSGWIGYIATTEWYFYAFDAAPVTLAVLILLPFHPGFFLPSGIKLMKRENNVPSIEEQVAEKRNSRWSSYQGDGYAETSDISLKERSRDVESAGTSDALGHAN